MQQQRPQLQRVAAAVVATSHEQTAAADRADAGGATTASGMNRPWTCFCGNAKSLLGSATPVEEEGPQAVQRLTTHDAFTGQNLYWPKQVNLA